MMIKKRYILVALGVISILLGCLFYSIVISASPGGTYDHWMDLNDDGVIDAVDLQLLAWIYGTLGTPINKTQLLLDLAARINSLNATLLADYYNKTDCDSLFALLAHMHSASDISGGILGLLGGVQQIRLGTGEGNHIIYFYENGSPFGEYIYWQDGGHQFVVSDDIYVGGTIEIPTTTRYYTVPAVSWLPFVETYTFTRTFSHLRTTTAGITHWMAEVNLPHGAVVTQLTAWIYDNDAIENVEVHLCRQLAGAGGSFYQMASVISGGAVGNMRMFSTSTISDSTINNANNAYLLWGMLKTGNTNHGLGQVRITYTITETLP